LIVVFKERRFRIATKLSVQADASGPNQFRGGGSRAVSELRKGARQTDFAGCESRPHLFMLTEKL
jgi:hypothetical protein